MLSLRKARKDVVVVLLLAAAAASFYSLTYDRSGYEYILRADEGYSFAASVRVVNGSVPQRDFTYSYGPFMPYVYALAFAVFGTSLAVLRASWAVLYVVSIILSYVLARQVLPRWPALISAAILIGQEHTPLYSYNHVGLVLVCQVAVLLAFVLWNRKPTLGWSALMGLFFLVALLIKFNEAIAVFLALGTTIFALNRLTPRYPNAGKVRDSHFVVRYALCAFAAPLSLFVLITITLNAGLTQTELLRNFPIMPQYQASVGGFRWVGIVLASFFQALWNKAPSDQWYAIWYENYLFAIVISLCVGVFAVVWVSNLLMTRRSLHELGSHDWKAVLVVVVAVALYHEFYLTGNHWTTPVYVGFGGIAFIYLLWIGLKRFPIIRQSMVCMLLVVTMASAAVYVWLARSTFSQVYVSSNRARIYSSEGSDAKTVEEVVEFLDRNTSVNTPVAAFPHDALLVHLAARRNPLRDDSYQWMLFPDRASDDEVVRELDRLRVRSVLVSNFVGVRRGSVVVFGRDYLPSTFEYLEANYYPVKTFDASPTGYQVMYLERKDVRADLLPAETGQSYLR